MKSEEQIMEMLRRIYELLLDVHTILNKKPAKSKFEQAVEHMESLSKINVSTYNAPDLLYPTIYKSRTHAKGAIIRMLSMGILKHKNGRITRG